MLKERPTVETGKGTVIDVGVLLGYPASRGENIDRVAIGDGSRLRQKFFKLETLYREGFRQKGWNQYEIINLKYHNQVICTKR